MTHDPLTIIAGAERTFTAVLARAAQRWPDRAFLLDDEEGRPGASFDEFARRVDAVAGGLLASGIEPGENVGVLAPNGNEVVALAFALARIGARPTMVSTNYRGANLERVLASTLQGTRVFAPRPWWSWLPASIEPRDVHALPDDREAPRPSPAAPHDVAIVLPTSGTTGVAKGVALSYSFCVRYAETGVWMRQLDADDAVYGFTPLFHADGIFTNVLASVLVGASVYICGTPSPKRFWLTCRSRGLTTFSYAGGLIGALASVPEQPGDDDNPVRVAFGAPSPPDKARAFEARFGLHLAEGYGSTEVGIPIVAPWDGSRVEEGSCGRALPGYDLRLLDDGELLVRPRDPHFVMEGYVGDDVATRHRLPGDGWFHTGDVLADIGDGHFAFRGRKGHVIRTKGEFVAPVVIEQAAEAGDDVVEAAAYGVPSPTGEPGEELVALAVIAPDRAAFVPDALRRRLASVLPAAFVPAVVVALDELPRSPGTGKVQKQLLPGTALGTVRAWADAWNARDAESLQALFDPEARYVSLRLGPLEQVHRQLRIGVRTWRACTVEDLEISPQVDRGGSMVTAEARYRFAGTDRDGVSIEYRAVARFELALDQGQWRITRFEETADRRV